jgi:small neutral amino acid transporter SnatA (MarC family)
MPTEIPTTIPILGRIIFTTLWVSRVIMLKLKSNGVEVIERLIKK